jgi:iron complex outermembrane receptor protein
MIQTLKWAITLLAPLCITLLAGTPAAFGQFTATGTVSDATNGNPLPGATLMIVGKTTGSVTDTDGRFSLDIPTATATVEVRFAGYTPRRLSISANRSAYSIELQPKTLALDGVTVSAFASARPLLETAGSIAVISTPTIERSQNLSLAPALNTIAGVRMEESGYGGSSRVSIRGSLLRAPFGIRNVKMYWNDIPLTDPSGSTSRFNSLDASDIGRVEVIKGPGGSLYGAGTGGVLILDSRRPVPGTRAVEFEQTSGAFALNRSAIRANWSEGQARVRLSVLDQESDGYRDHQRVSKRSLQFSAGLTPSSNRDLGFHVFHYDGTYQLPGGLTAAQVESDPRMAVPFSKSINANVSLRNTGIAISQRLIISPKWQNTTSFGLIVQDKENPSGTSAFFNQHEISTFQGLTGRTVLRYQSTDATPLTIHVGLEAQTGFSLEKYYTANMGVPGTLRSDAEVEASTFTAFVQVEEEVTERLIATVGASLNLTNYDVIDRLGEQGLGGRDQLGFGPTFAPRAALVYKLTDHASVHGSLSYGFSVPTQWEVKTLAGVNSDLRAEQGLNTEVGVRWQSSDARYAVDVTGYRFGLKQALLPQFTPEGLPFFSNVGSTIQDGIELAATAVVLRSDAGAELSFNASGAWNNYTFDNYVSQVSQGGLVVNRDFSGKAMPGIAPWSGSASADLEMPFGVSLHIGARYMDRIPITDANDVYSREYLLVSARVDAEREVLRSVIVGARLGVDNLTDVYWDNLLALNGAGGRYFNPGPKRNGYVRLNVKYVF